MSAGEFFDLVRPAFLLLAAFISTWVLVDAQRIGLRIYYSLAWALATLALPLIFLPLYLVVKLHRTKPTHHSTKMIVAKLLAPAIYLTVILAIIAISEYRDSKNVDTHLARATQAKLAGDRRGAILEYKAALAVEDNPHTRKLLGLELNEEGDWTAALSEFRLAERGGEPDGLLPFHIARLLDALNLREQALMEYKRFLYSESCLNAQAYYQCDIARRRSARVDSP